MPPGLDDKLFSVIPPLIPLSAKRRKRFKLGSEFLRQALGHRKFCQPNVLPASCRQTERRTSRIAGKRRAHQAPQKSVSVRMFLVLPFLPAGRQQHATNVLPASCRPTERKKTPRIAGKRRAHQAPRKSVSVRMFLVLPFLPAGRQQHADQRAAGILPADRTEEDATNCQETSSAPSASEVGISSDVPRASVSAGGTPAARYNVLPASCRQTERKKTPRIAKQRRAHQAPRKSVSVRMFLVLSLLPAGGWQHVSCCCAQRAGMNTFCPICSLVQTTSGLASTICLGVTSIPFSLSFSAILKELSPDWTV